MGSVFNVGKVLVVNEAVKHMDGDLQGACLPGFSLTRQESSLVGPHRPL